MAALWLEPGRFQIAYGPASMITIGLSGADHRNRTAAGSDALSAVVAIRTIELGVVSSILPVGVFFITSLFLRLSLSQALLLSRLGQAPPFR